MNFKSVRFVFLTLTIAASSIFSGCRNEPEEGEFLRIMTFNIRYANPDDGDFIWSNRKDWVGEIIGGSEAHVIGLQEALRHQIDTLSSFLPAYRWIGRARNDGKNSGEFSPLFYRPDLLDMEENGTFWLSSTPQDTGSVGWDAALPRIATWARFRIRDTKTQFLAVNTHFDHRGKRARLESARLLNRWVRNRSESFPVVMMGDFNTLSSEPPYAALLGELPDVIDTVVIADTTLALQTFRGFEAGGATPVRIDYIFVTPGIILRSHVVLDEDRGGRYPSDHLPVVVDLELMRP